MTEILNTIVMDPERRERLMVRFNAKVGQAGPDDCWPWLAKAKLSFGYGVINSGAPEKEALGAHRVAWALVNGPIPAGSFILHSCDRPDCCNPAHLRPGTAADNMADVKLRKRRAGYRHSQETIAKIKANRKPPAYSSERRARISEQMRKRWEDPQFRENFTQKTSGPNNPRFGKRPPEHQLEAVRRNHRKFKGYRHTEETKQKMRDAWARKGGYVV